MTDETDGGETITQIPDCHQARYEASYGDYIPELLDACRMLIASWRPDVQAFDLTAVREAYEKARDALFE